MTRHSRVLAPLIMVSAALLPIVPAAGAQTAAAPTPAAKFVDSARVEIDRAVLASDTPRLEAAIVLLDRALVAFPNDPYLLHYRGYARYHQAVNALNSGNVQGASPFIDKGVQDLQQSSDKLPWPETWSLLYALNAFRIAVDPSQAATIGMELGAYSERASQLGPNNPRVLLIEARGAMNTPPEYGGGLDKARPILERALKAFETDKPAPLAPAWGREEAIKLKAQLDKGGV